MDEALLKAHLSLTRIPNIGESHIQVLLQHFSNPHAVFQAKRKSLEAIPGIGQVRAQEILQFKQHQHVEKEMQFIAKNKIQVLIKGEANYPKRLLNCSDSPHVLFYKGNTSLDAKRIVAVIGTRSPTDYGKEIVLELIRTLADYDVLVLSGLAYGVDSLTHRASVHAKIPTVGVLGHGLDKIYPFVNRELAAEMLQHGGLLTEFMSGTQPDRQNFPKRNRIVAGLADVVVVVESGIKGGSLITADIANSYHKDVLAFPGRCKDTQSEGCNWLIQSNRANLICSGSDVIRFMNWDDHGRTKNAHQLRLFEELSEAERHIVEIVQENPMITMDGFAGRTTLRPSHLPGILLGLEIKGIVRVLPGNRYQVSLT